MTTVAIEHSVSGYTVWVETMRDDCDPERGEWVECWVKNPRTGHTNSLALLEDLGAFDDGPKITNMSLTAIRRFAERHGYE